MLHLTGYPQGYPPETVGSNLSLLRTSSQPRQISAPCFCFYSLVFCFQCQQRVIFWRELSILWVLVAGECLCFAPLDASEMEVKIKAFTGQGNHLSCIQLVLLPYIQENPLKHLSGNPEESKNTKGMITSTQDIEGNKTFLK